MTILMLIVFLAEHVLGCFVLLVPQAGSQKNKQTEDIPVDIYFINVSRQGLYVSFACF